jgi:hypothetical protein
MMDQFERAARREARTGFFVHLTIFIGIQLMLFVIWFMTSNGGEVLPWFLFPLFGWGVGLVAHYVGYRASVARDDRP